MGLTPEQIEEIYKRKLTRKTQQSGPVSPNTAQGGVIARRNAARKLSKKAIHYATLPKNHLVRYHDGRSLRCASTGCGAPTLSLYRGEPLCNIHIVIALVHDINYLSEYGRIKSPGFPSPATQAASLPPEVAPPMSSLVAAAGNPGELQTNNEVTSDTDRDTEYL